MMKVRKTENPHEIKHFSLKKYTYFVDSIDFESQIGHLKSGFLKTLE